MILEELLADLQVTEKEGSYKGVFLWPKMKGMSGRNEDDTTRIQEKP